MPARLKQGDEVIVVGGKDRGKRGRILRVDPKDGKPTRVGIQIEDGKRLRVAKRSGARLD